MGLLLILLLFHSCSTKKNTFTRRVYHNLTSHYNGYFNGKEALKDARNELARIALDNYSVILPVVNYGSKENVQAITPNLDRAISKASMVISRHSIYLKNVEYIRWIDDSYLLMGKAQFYKQDYKTAYYTFEFITKRYKNNDIRHDAQLWMAKCLIQTAEYSSAQSLLDDLQNKLDRKKAPSYLNRDLALTYAEFYIQQHNYPPAEEYLLMSLKYPHQKALKARLHFILGQVQQRRGDLARASASYMKVIRTNPGYELVFNAKINLARCYDASSGNSREIVATLKKMLKDEKNNEYLDQIYYALAEIAEKDGDKPLVKEYLASSVKTSTRNKYQKGISSLKLANIYYLEPEYPPAQAYYDTAVQSLPSEYPDLAGVRRRAKVLDELVKNLNILETEDSLQRIARMPEKERNAFIDKLIAKVKEEEMKKQAAASEHAMGMSLLYRNRMNNPGANQMGGGSGATWYFYNPAAVSMGFTEFEKKWGKRKLEDNWRLSDKQMILDDGDGALALENAENEADTLSKDPKDRKTYEQYLPLTEEMVAKSNEKIKEALYNLGNIYYHGLSDFPQSVLSYESLISRFPADTSYFLKSAYSIYEMCLEQKENSKADYYKNLITSKYPDSDFAKIIANPEYKKEILARKNKAANLYKEAYAAYENQQYNKVLNYCGQARGATSDKSLNARFDYLESVSRGKVHGKDTMTVALRRFITQHPSSELKALAQKVLDYLNSGDSVPVATASAGDKPVATARNFVFNPEAIHLFVIVVGMKNVNINALKLRVSDHNQKYSSLDKLSTSNLYLDDNRQLITVSNFPGKEEAMNYLVGITGNAYVFSNLNSDDYQVFVISVDNYQVFYRSKDVDKYLEFYRENYPQ